jgi:hypothetical protein
MKSHRFAWLTLLASGSLLLQGSCLGSFWQGVTRGFPAGNRWLNVAIDVAHEVLLG